jgi:hypothetical protein
MTIEDALSRRDEGIQRAADHAGIRWQRLARGFLLEFLSRPIGTFLAEDVRCFAEIRGLGIAAGLEGMGGGPAIGGA